MPFCVISSLKNLWQFQDAFEVKPCGMIEMAMLLLLIISVPQHVWVRIKKGKSQIGN